MENINFDVNLAQIKMDKAKAAASMLKESWNGPTATNAAGSYVDGVKKEIAQASSEDIKLAKPSFSVGVLETALALKNTSFVELSEGRILTERYINNVSIKGVSEALLIESMIQDLTSFSWENNAKSALSTLKKTYESKRKEIEVAKAIEQINNSGGRDLFSSMVESMKNWLSSENRISEKLINDLKKWAFNPTVRTLVENLHTLEAKNPNKFGIKTDSSNCEVKAIVAPTFVSENFTVFVTSDRFFKSENGKISIMEKADAAKLSGKFLKAALALSNPSVKINENGLDFFIGKNKISAVFENEVKNVYFNGKRIANDKLGFILSMELRNSFQASPAVVENAMAIIEAADHLAEVDFGKKIVSKIYEGVEANVFKVGEKVYVHQVNPAMRKNELFEGNGNQAVNLVKEFLGFDLSESITEVLEKEEKILAIMKNDKESILKNLKIVENEAVKLNKAIELNPKIKDSQEIKEAQAMLQTESTNLKSKWNQINVEIERFEKSIKKVNISENEGYGINTEIKVRRSGEKGKVVGVNGNSKTYTVMFENGTTGEFFFSDIINMNDEVANTNLEITNESEDANFAEAPNKTSKGSAKDIENVKNHNLAEAPKKTATGSSKDIENLKNHNLAELKAKGGKTVKDPKGVSGDMELAETPAFSSTRKEWTGFLKGMLKKQNLAEAPGGEAKGSPKFIENLKNHQLAESQTNQHVEKAPKGKTEKPKKFVEDLDDAELAEAPGNNKKNGKKDHEPLNRATLAKAPKSKTKKK